MGRRSLFTASDANANANAPLPYPLPAARGEGARPPPALPGQALSRVRACR